MEKSLGQLSPTDRFLYWIRERHDIHKKRMAGESKPWTKDPVLQTVFFTNPYRENDKTTVWFRENVRDPLRDDPIVFMSTVIFRWFNRITTGQVLINTKQCGFYGLLDHWNKRTAIKALNSIKGPVFTGAFMIKIGNGPPGSKIVQVCDSITDIWKQRKRLLTVCERDCRMESLWKKLKQFRGLGGFLSYEIVCDLRYTCILENATDIDTWSNMGPGAKRGLNRILERNFRSPINKQEWQSESIKLLKLVRSKLQGMPRMEMREVEHSLCEFDKYERARLSEGKLKRKYRGI